MIALREDLVTSAREFVLHMLTEVLKQEADDVTIERLVQRVLLAFPPSIRYEERRK